MTPRVPGIMIKVQSRGRHPGTGAMDQRCDIEDVIEVTMRENDPANWNLTPSSIRKGTLEASRTTDKTRVEKVERVAVTKDIETHAVVANCQ